MSKKILIIEDEEVSAIALEQLLISFGYEVTDSVNNVEDARKSIQFKKPDLIISDIMIKGGVSGCEFALEMSTLNNIPFIFITAHFDDELLNYALDSNVHGYLLKPFNSNELQVSIKIALKKSMKPSIKQNKLINFDTFSYNIDTNEVIKKNKTIKLGNKSTLLLKLLSSHINSNVTYERILSEIYDNTNLQNITNLRQLVKRLKETLETKAIVSIKSIGYMIKN